MKDIFASLVLYNEDPGVVQRAVASFLDTRLDVAITIIDNSADDRLKVYWRHDPRISYHFIGRNLGFSAGHNLGFHESLHLNSRCHLVLNPDIYFEPGVLEALFEYMETHPEAGLLLPKVLYPDGSVQYLYRLLPTPFDLLIRRFLPRFAQKWLKASADRYELKIMNLEQEHEVPFLSGCFMFLRTQAIREVGGFDERFFMYMDDVDLSRRIQQKYKNIYFPYVAIIHEHKRTSYKNWKCLRHHLRSAFLYFNKWGWFIDPERRRINRSAFRKIAARSDKASARFTSI